MYTRLRRWIWIGFVALLAGLSAAPQAVSGADTPAPNVLFCSAVSIWLEEAGAQYEYGIRAYGATEEFDWQDSNLFFGLQAHTEYELAVRSRATQDAEAGQAQIRVVSTDDWQYSARHHLYQGTNAAANSTAFQTGGNVLYFAAPTRKGYQFMGWYADSDFSKPLSSWDCTTQKNLHVYARWRKVQQGKVTGVKAVRKGKATIRITFSKIDTASRYEIQYSTDSDFSSAETVTVQTEDNRYTASALARGMRYYVRVRSVSWDSCGNVCYGAYSAVKTRSTKPLTSGASLVQSGKMAAGKSRSGIQTGKKKVIRQETQYLRPGDSKMLTLPPKSTSRSKKANALRITVSDSTIATVGAKGKVRAKQAGRTTVKLRRGGDTYVYPIVVEEVRLNQKKVNLVVGEKTQLKLTGASSKVSFATSADDVVKVSKTGRLTAIGAGSATVTAKYHDHSYRAKVSVITVEQSKIQAVQDFSFSSTCRELAVSESCTVEYCVSPASLLPENIAWYTSDSDVVTVQNGVIHAVAPGNAFVCVKYQKKTARIQVRVVSYEWEKTTVRFVSHRGSSAAPENSLAAFEQSADDGYQYVETDIRWTKDNVPVLLHDKTVGRTSNALENLAISSLTYEECKALDFGEKFGESYKDTRIVRFDEFLKLCRSRGLHCYIELKGTIYREQSRLLAKLVSYYDMEGKVSFISFSAQSLISMRELLPQARCGYLCNAVNKTSIKTFQELSASSGETFLDVSYTTALSAAQLKLIADAGISWECYTVDSVELAQQAIAQGAFGITTNTLRLQDGQILDSKTSSNVERSDEAPDEVPEEEKTDEERQAEEEENQKNTDDTPQKTEDSADVKKSTVQTNKETASGNAEPNTGTASGDAEPNEETASGDAVADRYADVKRVYSIQYYLNGGTVSGNPTEYTPGQTLFVASPTRSGYQFAGWYTDATLQSAAPGVIPADQKGTLRLYAKWTLAEYQITYQYGGGKTKKSNPQKYRITDGVQVLQPAVRKGYLFEGWYRQDTGQRLTCISGSLGQDLVLQARWSRVSPGRVTGLRLKNKDGCLTIRVRTVKKVAGYEYQYWVKGSGNRRKAVSTRTGYTLLKLRTKKRYCVRVRAYAYDSCQKKVYGSYSKTKSIVFMK